uniref:TSA: Wollemia nobilis Ref_Wollemi_Transcript_8402_1412 transcribed RNA sequence n=1 Tax=Wollemia nobilis TaxID=56998 RepID=A0A0C9S7I1_9CONI
MAQTHNPHLKRGPWIEGNVCNNNNGFGCGGGHTRRFQEVGHRRHSNYEDNGPPPKRRRDAYFHHNNPNSFQFPLMRRTEEERLCVPSMTEDRDNSNSNFNGNGLRVGGEETSCSDGSEFYYTREAIERLSPSRRDGIDLHKEIFYRLSYVSFLQTLGMRLQLPQTTIATAIVLCHRFFLRRSHASCDRFLIATASLFLAAKSEETPRPLNNVLVISYQLCHEQDLASFHYLLSNDWFEQYKQHVLEAEHMLLIALDFEITVQHPYKPLTSVLSKIGLAHTALLHMAWNFVNEGLRSSLCLQFKPQHIAAGAVFLAAKALNFDISSTPSLFQEFQTTSSIIQDVVKQLTEVYSW